MKKDNYKFPQDVYSQEYDIHIRPYLTLQDIQDIGSKMAEAEDYVQQEIIKNQGLIDACVIDGEFDGMDYDMLASCGLFKEVAYYIQNAHELYDYVAYQKDVKNQLNKFLAEAIKYIKTVAEFKQEDVDKIVEKLKAIK